MPTVTAVCLTWVLSYLNGCPPPPPLSWEDYHLLVTFYDTSRGGINCDIDCNTYADGTAVNLPDDYGEILACIPQWLGSWVVTPHFSGKCRDTGGAIVITYNEDFGVWVIHVDRLDREETAYCHYCLVKQWRVTSRPPSGYFIPAKDSLEGS